MSEFTFKKTNSVYSYFYDINGNETKDESLIVAKEIVDINNGNSYYVRLEAGKPAYHETFKKSAVINPTFVKLSADLFKQYAEYLITKREGLYQSVTYSLRNSGII